MRIIWQFPPGGSGLGFRTTRYASVSPLAQIRPLRNISVIAKLPSGGEEYKNVSLPADGSSPGAWNRVTIEGDKWIYFGKPVKVERKSYGATRLPKL
jgi:hypothetical protein